jgi:threonine aldolase
MRQAGYMAAAANYALDHHIERLAEDHQHAREIAALLATRDYIGTILPVETNLVIFEVKGRYTAATLVDTLKHYDIHCLSISPTQIRMVTHLDVTRAMTDHLLKVLNEL